MKNNRRNTDLVHQHVRISSLRQSLYPVYDAIRCKREIEMVQRRAARYATNRYHNTSSVTDMLQDLDWESLESRRVKTDCFRLWRRCAAVPAHKAYIALTTHPVLCIHFGFNKGILTIARQYPTPVSIKWKCGALLIWILKVFQNRVQFCGDRRDNIVCTVSSPLFLDM